MPNQDRFLDEIFFAYEFGHIIATSSRSIYHDSTRKHSLLVLECFQGITEPIDQNLVRIFTSQIFAYAVISGKFLVQTTDHRQDFPCLDEANN